MLSETLWPDLDDGASGPLRGVRVLDFTTVLMGPSATQMLGDMGADVVKVESEAGDAMRWIGPWRHAGMGPLFLQANRNKRSVVLDLKSAEGKASALALAGRADILVSNVRPQGMARLGLGPEAIAAVNPRIIYCAAVGYGAGGPKSGLAVYDDLMQAASGIAGLFASDEAPPRYCPINMCDRIVGLHVVGAVTAALYHRAMTGEGQTIEVPMFETMAQFVLADHIGGEAFVPSAGEMGYKRLLSRTRGPFATTDGYLSVVVYTERHWRDFSTFVGRPDLLDTDARFASPAQRTLHAEEIGRFVGGHMATRSTAEWLEILHGIDIPASAVNTLEMLFDDPHLRAVGMFEEREHPTEGMVTNCRFPVTFSRTSASVRRLAPNLGEHSQEVLS